MSWTAAAGLPKQTHFMYCCSHLIVRACKIDGGERMDPETLTPRPLPSIIISCILVVVESGFEMEKIDDILYATETGFIQHLSVVAEWARNNNRFRKELLRMIYCCCCCCCRLLVNYNKSPFTGVYLHAACCCCAAPTGESIHSGARGVVPYLNIFENL